jgi:hypothetical protein
MMMMCRCCYFGDLVAGDDVNYSFSMTIDEEEVMLFLVLLLPLRQKLAVALTACGKTTIVCQYYDGSSK